MLLALHILLDSLAPAENAPRMRVHERHHRRSRAVHPVRRALTWAAFQRRQRALVMSLAFAIHHPPPRGLVLGANLGSAINPVSKGRRGESRARLPVGNLSTGWPASCWWRRSAAEPESCSGSPIWPR